MNSNRKLKSVLIIHEGHAGHLTQSKGLAEAISRYTGALVQQLDVTLTLRGFLRPALRWLMTRCSQSLPGWLISMCYRFKEAFPVSPSVIVASGGQGLPFAINLSRKLKIPLVYCGDPAPYPPDWIDALLVPLPFVTNQYQIVTEMLPTPMSPARISDCGQVFRRSLQPSQKLGCLLIGGGSRSHRYHENDWDQLAAAINSMGQQGWRWLISTSSRTPVGVEALLQRRLNTEVIVKAVWWHQKQERILIDFLGAADFVFITQDSLSMLSEAVSAGKPLIALVPDMIRHSDFLEQIISAQQYSKRLYRVPIRELAQTDIDAMSFDLVAVSLIDQYAERLAEKFGWARG